MHKQLLNIYITKWLWHEWPVSHCSHAIGWSRCSHDSVHTTAEWGGWGGVAAACAQCAVSA